MAHNKGKKMIRYTTQSPHHLVGLLLRQADDQTLTHTQLVDKLFGHPLMKGLSKDEISSRIPQLIVKITTDPAHGGCDIETR